MEEESVFTEEQTLKVQKLIDNAYKKAYEKASKARGTSEEIKYLKSQLDSLKQERKLSVLYREISKHNVIDGVEVAELIKDKIVIGDDGVVVMCDQLNHVSVEEYVNEWLALRPYFLRRVKP